jgi:hypothetical protein
MKRYVKTYFQLINENQQQNTAEQYVRMLSLLIGKKLMNELWNSWKLDLRSLLSGSGNIEFVNPKSSTVICFRMFKDPEFNIELRVFGEGKSSVVKGYSVKRVDLTGDVSKDSERISEMIKNLMTSFIDNAGRSINIR